jgi:hypothetical protein
MCGARDSAGLTGINAPDRAQMPVIFRLIRPKATEPARFNWHPLPKPKQLPVIFR